MTSLKAKLSWSLTLSLVILLTLQWLVASYAISALTENQLKDRLERESENLLAIITIGPDGALAMDANRMGAIYQRQFSGHYYVVTSGQQQLISRSLWDSTLDIKTIAAGKKEKRLITGPDQQPLLMMLFGYKKYNRVMTVAVAENIQPLKANIRQFQWLYALISMMGLAVILWVQRKMILNALAPLHQVQTNIAQLEQGETSHLNVQAPTEIMPLILQINRLLTAMDKKYQRSRESIGNLAHSLKTKLTLLNQTAERLQSNSLAESQLAIYESTQAMHQVIERELKRARLIGDIRPGRPADLRLSVTELVNTLRQIYTNKGVSITWEIIGEARFKGDKEDLLEMLGNLLDNACKWCQKRVSLTITGGDTNTFIVEDDGAGTSIYDLNLLTRRGFRADEAKSGSGLGLAIVHDIVESYDGTLIFGRSAALGGMRAEVQFKSTDIKNGPF